MPAIAAATRLEMLTADVQRAGPRALAIFEQIMANGETAEWAAMCALRSPPGSRNTDRAFNQGQRYKMDRMAKVNADEIHKRAKAAGINTSGKYYIATLGKHTDPAAWVSSSDDVLAVCKARNLTCEGVINYKAPEREVPPPQDVPLAPDIVKRFEKEYIANEPGLAERIKKNPGARQELRERIVANHGKKKRTKTKRRV